MSNLFIFSIQIEKSTLYSYNPVDTGRKLNASLVLPTLMSNLFIFSIQIEKSTLYSYNPVDTGRKLNVHKTFRTRPGRLLNVLCTFNLRPVSTGKSISHDSVSCIREKYKQKVISPEIATTTNKGRIQLYSEWNKDPLHHYLNNVLQFIHSYQTRNVVYSVLNAICACYHLSFKLMV